jgi:predicted TIM-barrel fold metal-dependent hydrolase
LELAPRIEKLSCSAVIDHMGMFRPEGDLQQPAFQAVLRMISHGHWVKLSGAYRLTQQPAPPGLEPSGFQKVSHALGQLSLRTVILRRETPWQPQKSLVSG